LPEVQEASLASPRASVQIEETSSALPRIPPVRVGEGREVQAARQEEQKLLPTPTPLRSLERWQLPSVDLLDEPVGVKFSPAEMQRRAKLLEEALASYGVEAKVVEVNTGPTVTQFGVEPGWDRKYKEVRERDKEGNLKGHLEEVSRTRVKVDRITSLANDLALALAAPSIRVEAPVPGKPLVGIEVPNSSMGLATLREAVESPSFQKASARSKLTVALGKSTEGGIVTADLAKMPHLLIAGATGSGKTVCLDSIIASLLMSNTPEELQFLMVDPKRVELVAFSDLPHLTAPVITENEKAVEALKWLSQEMDKRYQKFSIVGAHNIERYNKSDKVEKPLPFLVLIIDELADLLSTKSGEVEPLICRLAQLSRATGIHEVVATQRPSVDVVTGLIKANFPTRISFAVVSQVDSRTILDCAGAEKLLGKGDMLYLPTEAAKPKRLQGFFVSEQEIKRLVEFWSSQREGGEPKALIPHVEGDPLLEQAKQLAREHKQVSVSFLQRQLRIGYPRAAQLMELLQKGDMLKSEEPKFLGKGETKDGKGINRDKDL
jgi:S-DNA-T family DNA segregation ATPase FtsK/SpoIIIE